MAAIAEDPTTDVVVVKEVHEICINKDSEKIINDKTEMTSHETESELKPESELDMQKLVAIFKKLNPLAKEFFPSYYNPKKNGETAKGDQFDDLTTAKKQSGEEFGSDGKKDDINRKV